MIPGNDMGSLYPELTREKWVDSTINTIFILPKTQNPSLKGTLPGDGEVPLQ